jgi:hypothetical protein
VHITVSGLDHAATRAFSVRVGDGVPPPGRSVGDAAPSAATARTTNAASVWIASHTASWTCCTVVLGKPSSALFCVDVRVNCSRSSARQSRVARVLSASESGGRPFLSSAINWLRFSAVSGGVDDLVPHRWSWPSSSVHRVLLWLLCLGHLSRRLELQRTAYVWPLPTFLLTLNKRRLLP